MTTEAGRIKLELLGNGYRRQYGDKEIIPRNVKDGIKPPQPNEPYTRRMVKAEDTPKPRSCIEHRDKRGKCASWTMPNIKATDDTPLRLSTMPESLSAPPA
ncbi:hypothetical protein V5799_003304 [Amblyomma americanum]|uniref:Uncharacterized protein n=1 Tax=Amblyomma americanum TaxID=6943 RepID=A0AAQ4D9C3_AMBAM